MIGRAALLLALLVPSAGPARSAAVHDTHLSTMRLVVEDGTAAARVRLFRDDLEQALRTFPRAQALTLRSDYLADSLVTLYVARTVTLTADGTPVALRVTGSGLETDRASRQEVAWYVLEGALPAGTRTVALSNRLLFDQFDDQQNIVNALRLPSGTKTTLYFGGGDPKPQVLRN